MNRVVLSNGIEIILPPGVTAAVHYDALVSQTPVGRLDSAYQTGANILAAVLQAQPEYAVLIDTTDLSLKAAGSGDKLPPIHYGSQDPATHPLPQIVLLNPEHPYFAQVHTDAPPAPGATVVDPTYVPGVSTGLPPAPSVAGPQFFPHGPAVGLNLWNQPIDAQGRTAGPVPIQPGASVISEAFRNKFVYLDGKRYDAWGNEVPFKGDFEPDPVYPSEADLVQAVTAGDYPQRVDVDVNGTVHTAKSGFGPPALFARQADGSVVRVS